MLRTITIMPRTRAARAKLAEEGAPLSPSQSLPNERRRRQPLAQNNNTPQGPSQSQPAEESSQHQPQPTQDAASPPFKELLETRTTRPPTRNFRTSETQTQSRTYRTGETQTSIFPPYGLPQVPFPGQSQVQVQLGWNNPHLQEDERVLSLNVPAEALPAMLSFVAQHPQVAGTDLPRQLEASPLFEKLLRDHDNDRVQVLTVIPGAKKRKREQEPTIESILEAKIQQDQEERAHLRNRNPTPSATDRERLRHAQIEETQNILQECRDSRANEPRRKRTCTKLVPDLYDEKGNLRLGRYKKVEFEVDDGPEVEQGLTNAQEQTSGNSFTENNPPQQHGPASTDDAASLSTEMTDTASNLIEIAEDPYNESERPYTNVPMEETFPEQQLQNQTHAEPETPRARGWGLTSIIPSSVSKFIPFSSRRTAPTITSSQPLAQSGPQVLNEPNPPPATSYRAIMRSSTRLQQDRNTKYDDTVISVHHIPNPPAVDFTPQNQVAKPGEIQQMKEELEQELRTKIEAEYRAKALEESERLTAALKQKVKEVDERDKRVERERKKLAQHLDEIIPGSKRKRMPSPEIIPNPVGGGFGMDLDYFYISDEDSDEEHATPTRRPQTKKARTSSHGIELIGSPSGNVGEASSTSQSESQNTPPQEVAQKTPTEGSQTVRASTFNTDLTKSSHRNVFFEASLSAHQTEPENAPNGPTMIFKVPSPTSSDDDDSEFDLESQQDIAAPPSPLAFKSSAPKQRPTPNYTTMPAPSHLVEKARQKALIHQPKTGSSLRNASRLSSSTAGSDPGEEQSRSTEKHSKTEKNTQCEAIYQNFLNTHVDAYEEYIKGVSPKVAELISATWTEEDTEAAEKAFDSGLENFDEVEVEAWINEHFEAWKAEQVTGAAA